MKLEIEYITQYDGRGSSPGVTFFVYVVNNTRTQITNGEYWFVSDSHARRKVEEYRVLRALRQAYRPLCDDIKVRNLVTNEYELV